MVYYANLGATASSLPQYTLTPLTSSASGVFRKPILRVYQNLICSSVALYGLILFYALTKEELAGRQPLAKFLSIKLIVFFTFYQGFVVRVYFVSL